MGIHVTGFAKLAELTHDQVRSTVLGSAADACWSDEEKLLIRVCDALHSHCDIDDQLWASLSATFPENALMELLMLAGFYRTVSYLTNALRMPLEDNAERFPRPSAGLGCAYAEPFGIRVHARLCCRKSFTGS
jgi:hypothetical protein